MLCDRNVSYTGELKVVEFGVGWGKMLSLDKAGMSCDDILLHYLTTMPVEL